MNGVDENCRVMIVVKEDERLLTENDEERIPELDNLRERESMGSEESTLFVRHTLSLTLEMAKRRLQKAATSLGWHDWQMER